MRIARFMAAGRPAILVDDGREFFDYGAALEARGYGAMAAGADPERRIPRMLRHGLLDHDFIAEQAEWARRAGRRFEVSVEGLTPLLPYRPGKVVCMARNYREHAREGGNPPPSAPTYFLKGDNCAVGPGEAIRLPGNLGRIEHEGELGVVIGKKASRVGRNRAVEFIFGYIVLNDVTAREFQRSLAAQGLPWFAAKGIDTFLPMGPWIDTSEMFLDEGVRITVRVNDALRQDALTSDMIWGVGELIEAITATTTLLPGDIIATGTPGGVGPIVPGDEVVVEIEHLGCLANPVVAA
ncbi:MAG: fumarylacetoacetate hydrolase family protein [Calditrichaeota bacterium]|nr:fumarylacetoacetate hydrolase family protein [Calditrichota bacterium]